MSIIKRDGSQVKFEKEKIEIAILKAMKYGSGIVRRDVAKSIADNVKSCFADDEVPTVEQVEKVVYYELINNDQIETAKSYEAYRAVQAFKRQENTTDESILSLVRNNNIEVANENSNKNSRLASTQRDLIAGEISKDIARRKLIPAHIVQAHDEGVLHYHDMDYAMQPIHNCFFKDTKFVTSEGVRSFSQCYDGEKVNVLDKDGNWRLATVREYEPQELQTVVLTSGRSIKKIRCTPDHRWLLKDGTITTNLKVGDRLYLLKEASKDYKLNKKMFCLGFIIGDGIDYYKSESNKGVSVRLCDNKTKYAKYFEESGYKKIELKNTEDVSHIKKGDNLKYNFINNKVWKYLSKDDLISLFEGYYAADGVVDRNGITTTNENIAEMIRDISAIAGYHIINEKITIRDTNYKKQTKFYNFSFIKKQAINKNWIVKDIISDDKRKRKVWCVEEPITKTFTLDGGIVTGNCMLINLEDMLENGTVINEKLVETPKSFTTACTVVTQIIAQIASGQYGGNSITIKHIAPYLRASYDKYYNKYIEKYSWIEAHELAKDRMMEDLSAGVQTIRYQLSTLQTSNGQSPFCTIYLEIEEGHKYETEMALICQEMLKQRIEGMKSPSGHVIGEAFPKLVYLLDKHNCLEGGKYDYITKLAAECSAKRLVPDYQSAKIMRQNYDGETFAPMGCRSHLSNWKDENGKYKWWGRFNQGAVSLNLVNVALTANKDMERFWEILDERLNLCKEALLVRYNLLLGTTSDVSPIHWQYGGIARLKKGEKIDKLLKNGYSTISLGYVGVYEMTQAMLGVSHTTPEGEEFALDVMKHLNKACAKWKKETGLGFGLYGTPGESLTSRFCRLDKQRFGVIPNVTDRKYYTNSYHIHVSEKIDAFSKLKFESQFHAISSGGCISYIEVPNMTKNLEAVEQVINYIYHNIQYAEINTRPDVCFKCSFTGEMKLNDKNKWECPQCGNDDKDEMQVMRRTCGYIGSTGWSEGRTAEIAERVMHL